MNSEDVLVALGAIDEKYLRACDAVLPKRPYVRAIASAAACIVLAIGSVFFVHHQVKAPKVTETETETVPAMAESVQNPQSTEVDMTAVSEDTGSETTVLNAPAQTMPTQSNRPNEDGAYGDTQQATVKGNRTEEGAPETMPEDVSRAFANAPSDATRYPKFLRNGNYYISRGNSKPVTGKALETVTLQGFDAQHTAKGELYQISGISPEAAVAVRFVQSGEVYTYVNRDFSPATLGELYDALDLSKTMTIGKVHNGGTYYKGVSETQVRKLFVRNAPVRQGDHTGGIQIHVSVPSLGYPTSTIFVTADGYLTTTLLESENSFFIGKEAAKAFYDYVENNCEVTVLEATTTPSDIVVVCTGPVQPTE